MKDLLLFRPDYAVDFVLLFFRVTLGLCFMVHGLGKLGLVGSGNMQGFVGWLKSLNVPFPEVQARMAMITELAGGLLLCLGLMTRLSCLGLAFTMAIAAFVGHRGAGYLITNNPPGKEYALNLGLLMVGLFITGPGAYSLDHLLFS